MFHWIVPVFFRKLNLSTIVFIFKAFDFFGCHLLYIYIYIYIYGWTNSIEHTLYKENLIFRVQATLLAQNWNSLTIVAYILSM